jgi:hypothetical protein
MQTFIITPSTNTTKKYDVMQQTATGSKKIASFGGKGYSDYTIHNDDVRKTNYIKRHCVNEDWDDLTKAGTWARYILWNKPTLQDSKKDMEKRFNIKIQVQSIKK